MKKPRFKRGELKGMPLEGGQSRSQVLGLTDSLALALSSLSQAEKRGWMPREGQQSYQRAGGCGGRALRTQAASELQKQKRSRFKC